MNVAYEVRMRAAELRGEARGEVRGELLGFLRGLEKAELRGEERKSIEIAQRMLAHRMSEKDVAEITGLPPDMVRALAEQDRG